MLAFEMRSFIFGTISAFVCLSRAVETVPEFRDKLAKPDSHVQLRRFLGVNVKSYAGNDYYGGCRFNEIGSKGMRSRRLQTLHFGSVQSTDITYSSDCRCSTRETKLEQRS